MIPSQQHDNNNNNTNNGMYDNIIKPWKEIEYAKEEGKHSIDTNNDNNIDDDDDDNDKYIRVKISCDFSKRDHLKYTNKNDDHQSRNNNKKKYNNNNNKYRRNNYQKNDNKKSLSLFQGWTKTDHNYFVFGAIDSKDIVESLNEEKKEQQRQMDLANVQINNINNNNKNNNKNNEHKMEDDDIIREEDKEGEEKEEISRVESNELKNMAMEILLKTKIKQKPKKTTSQISFKEKFTTINNNNNINVNGYYRTNVDHNNDKKFVSPYLQYLIGRSDRSKRRRMMHNNRNKSDKLIKRQDGGVTSMSTLEKVLEIRKSRDNQVSHDDILHLPVIAIAATDNTIIDNANINKYHHDDKPLSSRTFDNDKIKLQQQQTYSLLSKLDVNNNNDISLNLVIPTKPIHGKKSSKKSNEIRRNLYRNNNNNNDNDMNKEMKKDDDNNNMNSTNTVKNHFKKQKKKKSNMFKPIMPVSKPPTIAEMPRLYSYRRSRNKEKKPASLYPSFVKEKFKHQGKNDTASSSAANFRIQYYLKKHHHHGMRNDEE